MIRLSIYCIPLVAFAVPAFAEPTCEVTSGRLPMWQIAKTFEDAGGQISTMKVNDGCYEVYGKAGEKRVEVFYDPQTGVEIERE